MKDPKIFWIDLFCGAGGTSTGIHHAHPNAQVVACVNHDHLALESHKRNNPDCEHFEEDVRDLRVVSKLLKLVTELRKKYPNCKIAAWTSLECTNYSKAKGGLPRDADSRSLANSMFAYLKALNPDYFYVENVREFMSWGKLDKKGKPISRDKGKYYVVWRNKIKRMGYNHEHKLLNAADYGAYTSRLRYFGQFVKQELNISWPDPTHHKNAADGLKKWKPVRDVLDLDDEGESIFMRKKSLVDNTLERIYAGLIKFVAGGEDTFIKKYYSGKPKGKVISVNGPAGAITTIDGQAKVKAIFLNAYYSASGFIHSIDKPCPTVPTKDRFSKVEAKFLTSYYTSGGKLSSIKNPNPTLTPIPKQRVTSVIFMDQQYGNSKPKGVNNPVNSLTANPKFNLVKTKPWLMDTNFKNVGAGIDQPSRPIMACHKHQYLMNPQWKNKGSSLDKPSFTLIARMDKAPPYLVATESGDYGIAIFESDSEIMIKIKEFMVIYGIIDIKMRMLKIPELMKIQGFPNSYVLLGSKTNQKKFIGNSVEVNMAKALIDANYYSLKQAA